MPEYNDDESRSILEKAKKCEDIILVDNVIYIGKRLYVPKQLREKTI